MAKAQDYARPTLEYADKTQEYEKHDRKFIIGISIGAAIPSGDFASTNVKNSFWDFHSIDSTHLQGFAQTGFHFNITAAYMFTDNFGMIILLGNSSNTFDINSFSAAIGGYPASNLSGSYSTSEYLIGACVSYPLAKNLNFKASALIGLVNSNYPSLNIALSDTETYQRDINGGSGFAYNIMAGITYNITNSIGIAVNVAYTGTTVFYPSWTETATYTGYYPFSVSHNSDVLTMTMGLLKPTIGIEFRL
jgi:hypothetical protein